MSDWLTNKGAGPWAFQEQSEKLGYLNNPRWTSTPASEIEHEPCGYWRKSRTARSTKYNIVVSLYYHGLYAAHYDGNNLSFSGYSGETNGQFGNVIYRPETNTYLHAQHGDPARQILERSVNAPFTVLNTYTPFLAGDLVGAGEMILRYNPDLGKYICTSYTAKNAIQLNNALTREAKWYLGTVVTGTDGNLYYGNWSFNIDTSWDDLFRPISGGAWASRWSLVPNNIHDGSITPWGTGHYYGAVSSYEIGDVANVPYGDGAYFVTTGATGTPGGSGSLYRFSASDRALDPNSIQHITGFWPEAGTGFGAQGVHAGKVYLSVISYQPNKLAVMAYSSSTLQLLATSPVDDIGEWIDNRILAFGAGGLYESHALSLTTWRIRLLDYSSLQEIASATITVPSGGVLRNCIEYNASRLIIAFNSAGDGYIRVVQFPSGSTIDELKFSDYTTWWGGDTVINALIVPVQGSGFTPPTAPNPVWPFEAEP